MAIFTLASIISSPAVRRRLTLLGALCMLTSLLPIVYPSLFTSSINAQSQLRNSQVFQVGSIRMEAANDKIVPSIVVYVTVPNKDAGKKLAGSIVKEKLAACVNRVPGIESVYLWQGEIQTDSEELLIIKTRESLLDALTEHVKANHEYEVAEVIALPITGGSLPYLEWLKNSTRD